MARFLTQEWVDEWNTAMEGVPLPDPGPDAGLAMADGRVTVVEEVRGTPDGDVRLVMTIDAGTVHLELAPGNGGDGTDGGDHDGSAEPGEPTPTVTIVLSYLDAEAMSQGQLSPAQALNAGRIRVRGDLATLAASQQVLNHARSEVGDAVAPTTY